MLLYSRVFNKWKELKSAFWKKSIYDVIEKYILYQATKSIFQRGQYID